ncbi:MAG: NADP-dependent isocitrate dehydrogenase [Piscirickettsiaceae bacterium]|nr:NADP-dependent isocitrate dehydrogenase [Piscirickettsiaceae bacterium]
MSIIIYTKVDEAPALSSYSLLPIIRAFSKNSDIRFEIYDLSLAGRIIANFPDNIQHKQRIIDYLSLLGKVLQERTANIIKLPNISASVPQLKSAIAELQTKGYSIPDFPECPHNRKQQIIRDRYSKVLGSAVNPVLRTGNSDRRVPIVVKNYVRNNPHSMGTWTEYSATEISHMDSDDFYGCERSTTFDDSNSISIIFIDQDGNKMVLKKSMRVLAGEVLDATQMKVKSLQAFITNSIAKAKRNNILLSLHLKSTMMKISDPIIFGFVVKVFFKDVIEKYDELFKKLEVNFDNGLSDLYGKLEKCDLEIRSQIDTDINIAYGKQANLAMVDSARGITNLHIPSDIIIDSSMPAMISAGGKMCDINGNYQDTLAMIPDRSYVGVYKAVVDDCKRNGAFDPVTMGSISNVGLMADEAEEYGSHDKTFQVAKSGFIIVADLNGKQIFNFVVEEGNIFRMCQTNDKAINNWVKLAVHCAHSSKIPAIFWLDSNRAHDHEVIKKVNSYLQNCDVSGLDIRIMAPADAAVLSLKRMREGLDTISVTGNVLRDYNTDLFPILEVGTSARMLSTVSLIKGGSLFETGSGGSAPKHVHQLLTENHLRWDSLGEFMALALSLRHLGETQKNTKAQILAYTINIAIGKLLLENKLPSKRLGQLDNRGSHFYLAMYWAQALAEQTDEAELRYQFIPIARALVDNEDTIVGELSMAMGEAIDIGGYYLLDDAVLDKIMRPSSTFNNILSLAH